uniref:Topoisomerase 6 subunit A/Spo11 TOPRIM domain-containing protein n=1 Tax=Cucumis sativus TaxID=3659 RepID=A0A0A0K3F7_CUCSA
MFANRSVVSVFERAVFQRLANDRFCSRNQCIVITESMTQGRGYPDVSTRRFLRLLVDVLALLAFCLVDCDPYGFDILTTYLFGSMVTLLKLNNYLLIFPSMFSTHFLFKCYFL